MTPSRNRVTPLGEIEAFPLRGAWTGNRGILHRDQGGSPLPRGGAPTLRRVQAGELQRYRAAWSEGLGVAPPSANLRAGYRVQVDGGALTE